MRVMSRRSATDRGFAVNLIPSATEPGLLNAEIGRCFGAISPVGIADKSDTHI